MPCKRTLILKTDSNAVPEPQHVGRSWTRQHLRRPQVSVAALEKDLEYAQTRVTELEAAMPQTNQSLNASRPGADLRGVSRFG